MSAQVLSWQRVKPLPAPVWLLLWGNFFVRGSFFGAASLNAIGFSLSPFIGGLIIGGLGGPALFAISAGLCALGLACYAATPRLRRPDVSALKLPG